MTLEVNISTEFDQLLETIHYIEEYSDVIDDETASLRHSFTFMHVSGPLGLLTGTIIFKVIFDFNCCYVKKR